MDHTDKELRDLRNYFNVTRKERAMLIKYPLFTDLLRDENKCREVIESYEAARKAIDAKFPPRQLDEITFQDGSTGTIDEDGILSPDEQTSVNSMIANMTLCVVATAIVSFAVGYYIAAAHATQVVLGSVR